MLRDYQKELNTKILAHLEKNQKCCASLATGAGKTFTFIELVKSLRGKTLILVNRIELVKQTLESMNELGLFALPIIAQTRNIKYSEYAVGMTQTVQSRFKSGKFDYNKFDNIIIDECHRLDYSLVHQHFTGKIIGFTATPIIEKKETYVNDIGVKMSRKIPLSKYYDTLIEGVDIKYLIDNNFLVPERVFESKHFNESALKIDQKTGDYSTKSQNDIFNSSKSYEELYDVINKRAKGKKTIIFNASSKINSKVYDNLKMQGYPVKMYDSVNSDTKERNKTVEWFKNTDGAVLCNVNVFTTGFDVKEVECIVLNRSTMSLSLFLQMVGRGGRITDKIYKPYFTLIDLGGNVSGRSNSFGNWSDERDWSKHFYDDTEKELKEKNDDPKQCKECGALINQKATVCEYCGAEQKKKTGPKKQISSGDLVQTKKPRPRTDTLITYCERNGLNINKARSLFANSIAEMFEDTPETVYEGHKQSGYLEKRIKQEFKQDYFKIQGSSLEGSRNRKLDTFIESIIKAIEKYYEKQRR